MEHRTGYKSACKDCESTRSSLLSRKPKIKIEEKKCRTCRKTKTLDKFCKNIRSRDGYHGACKSCDKKSKKRYEPSQDVKFKKCNKCNEKKAINNFYSSTSNKDGYSGACKHCDRIRQSERKELPKQTPETKRCSACRKVKPSSDFHTSLYTRTGLVSKCKPCNYKANKTSTEKHKERVIAYRKEYSSRPEIKERARLNARRRKAENPEKYKEKGRLYRKKAKEHIKKQSLEYRSRPEVRERMKRYGKERYEKFKDIIRAKEEAKRKTPEGRAKRLHEVNMRRAKKQERTPLWLTDEQKIQIQKKYMQREKRTNNSGIEYHVDHTVPLVGFDEFGNHIVSGLHVPWNLRVITADANLEKGSKFYDKWIHPCVRTT
jgi:hypothetical protein